MSKPIRRTRRVTSGEVDLHIVEVGERGRPPLLLVHGFPDDHGVYDLMMDDLGRDYHVAAFDLRGIGESTVPRTRSGYRIDAVLPDFTAVIDAVFGPSARVHLIAHDWGSVLSFSYVADRALQKRVHSFVSVSGPHLTLMIHASLRHIASLRPGEALQGLGQLASSWYVAFIHIPWLPEWLCRRYGPKIYQQTMLRGGVPASDPYARVTREQVLSRTLNGLQLYRQNVTRPPKLPAKSCITVATTLVVPLLDPFLRPSVYAFMREYVPNLTVRELPNASHWVPRSHPKELCSIVREHLSRLGASESQRAKLVN